MSTAAQRRSATFEDEIRNQLADLQRRITVLELRDGPRDQADAALIPAIAGAIGARRFTCRELVAHARVDRALASALTAADVDNPRNCGKLLRRLERSTLDGFVLARVGQDRGGIVWAVQVLRV